MININNKSWNNLRFSDIRKLLSNADDETFFFEFKSDDVSTQKLIEEISAFANTYGGYILIGISDDKTIQGCHKWTENRIHNTIHDSISPIPIFDVKKFKPKEGTILVIKVEEGDMPPYITSRGKIYERVSSGSYPIKESSKITQLYQKQQNQMNQIKQKIELAPIAIDKTTPENMVGYLDIGFSISTMEPTYLAENFYTFDFTKISEYLKSKVEYSIARLGDSYVVSIGGAKAEANNGQKQLLSAGINNFIEVQYDGSVRCRIILHHESNTEDKSVDISTLLIIRSIFQEVYSMFMGENFDKIFINSQKYEQLTVIKQFHPFYKIEHERFNEFHRTQKIKYGYAEIISGNRIPKSNYLLIDKRSIIEIHDNYSLKTLLDELFKTYFIHLGYIDEIPKVSLK